ncbi:MAG: ribonuclease P protein component [Chromatiaceae bacterium]|nr:ribonuclease P protein component [Chromatiaceae bacterium]
MARLRRPADFRKVFAQPAKSIDSCFTVLARPNGHRPARIGLAISKKNARRAVDRSRIKRVVRESFRQRRHHLHGIDLVVLCRRSAVTLPNGRLFSSLSAHWTSVRDQLCAIY